MVRASRANLSFFRIGITLGMGYNLDPESPLYLTRKLYPIQNASSRLCRDSGLQFVGMVMEIDGLQS